MRIACSIAVAVLAAFAVSCGGAAATSSDDRADSEVSPVECARNMAAAYTALAGDYDALCRMRREALAESDDVLRSGRLAEIDSLVGALVERSRALDEEWWHRAVEYHDRRDGSFTEFCRGVEIDSARVDVDIYRICELHNYIRPIL